MREYLRATIVFLALFTILFGGIYPLASTAIIKLAFSHEANGSLIVKDGKVLGSELIGQNFTSDKYFWGRLSATTPPYNAAASSGSNLGSNNPALIDAAKARVAVLKGKDVPVDLATASGSGLDPQISVAAAEYQINRVAYARGINPLTVKRLVEKYTEGRQFGVLGEPRVNVLELNLSLDGKI